MSISPQAAAGGVVSLAIVVAGKAIPDTAMTVSVETLSGLNTNSSAEIVVLDGDSADQTWPLLDSDIFGLDNKIQIYAGYDGDNDIIFEGVIVKQCAKVSGDNYSRLILKCLNSEKVSNLGRSGSQAGSIDPVLNIAYGEDLMAFKAEVDSELSPFVLDRGNYLDLKNFKFESTRTKGSILFQGFAKVAPGVTLNLAGVGERFAGLVFVNSVRHEIKDGNWITEIEFWRPDSLA